MLRIETYIFFKFIIVSKKISIFVRVYETRQLFLEVIYIQIKRTIIFSIHKTSP